MLRLALLGPPVVSRDGRPVSFDTRKATALLAVLAVEGRPQPRDRLAALLWPDADATRARSALRRTLSVAAAAVGGALRVDRSLVALDPATSSSDVDEFRSLANAGDSAGLRGAAELYRDDFLAGFTLRDAPEFEDWQVTVAGALRRDLGGVLAALADLDVRQGDLDVAVTDAERWLALDPLNEPAHQALIRLYAWRGQRSAALRQYRACVRVLDAELGVEPLEETTRVYDAVRRNALEPPPPANLPAEPARGQPGPAVAAARVERPIVGRSAELDVLRDALADRDRGHGFLVAVTGPSGIGKTSMLREVPTLAPPGVVVAAVRCHPEEANLAFGAAMELTRAAIAAAPDVVAQLPRHVRSELTRLLPEIAGLDGAPLTSDDDPAGPARLYAAVRELFLAIPALLVVVVDDAHWLDAASADLLSYLVRRLDATPLVLCLSWATDVGAERAVVLRAAADAIADGRGVELALRPLTASDVATLLDAGPDVAVDVDRVLAETGGVPSVATAYLDALAGGQDTGSATPEAVRAALASRMRALSETTQQVVAAAAVLGGRVDAQALRATSGRGDAETVGAVEEAVRAGFLVEESGADGYDFPFEMLRRVVVASMTGARRRLLHARAAEALSRRADGRLTAADAGAVARHLHEAGREHEAGQWHWRAAQAARRLYAHEEALGHVRDALATGDAPAEARTAEGELLIALGRYRDAVASLERAAATSEQSGELGRIELRLADVHHRLGDFLVADAHLATALELFDEVGDDGQRAVALAERALVSYRCGALDDAQRYADAALAVSRRTGDHATLAQSLDVLGVLAARSGQLGEAERLLQESLDHARRGVDHAAAIAASNNLARVLAAQGLHDEALRLAGDALQRGERHGDRHRLAALHTNLADLLRATGRDDDAMEHLKRAASMFAGVDDETQRRPEIWKLVEW